MLTHHAPAKRAFPPFTSRRATLSSVFEAFIGTLSLRRVVWCVLHFTTHNSQQQQHIPTRDKASPPSTFLFLLLLLLLLVWLFDAIYIYKTDRQRKCSLFLLLRRRRARVFSIAPFRAANEEEKSRDFREDASVTAKTFASSRRHRRR